MVYKKSASGQKFKHRWETRRKNKLLFILLYGFVLHSLYFGNTMYWLLKLVNQEEFNWNIYGYWLLAAGLAGIGSGFVQFRNNEKQYQQILEWEAEENN